MLPVKLIIEVENELTKLGYRFGMNKLIAGWVHVLRLILDLKIK